MARNTHTQESNMPAMPIPFPGETLHGPAPRPTMIDAPRIWTIGETDPYSDTQCGDMRDGDVFRIEGTNIVGMLVGAWPIALFGDGASDYGMHGLADGADIRSLGADCYGRLFDVTICPKDAEKFVQTEYLPVRGGSDYTASVSLARATFDRI